MKRMKFFGAAMVLLVMYLFIVVYAMFAVVHMEQALNCIAALVFEVIGVAAFGGCLLWGVSNQNLRFAYFVGCLVASLFYNAALNFLNFLGAFTVGNAMFLLMHFILFFVFCAVSFPMYLMGRK